MDNNQKFQQQPRTLQYFHDVLELDENQFAPKSQSSLIVDNSLEAPVRPSKNQFLSTPIKSHKTHVSPHLKKMTANVRLQINNLKQFDDSSLPLCSLAPPVRTIEKKQLLHTSPRFKPQQMQATKQAHKPAETPTSCYDPKTWIHCNHCFEPYFQKRKPIFILSCQHLLCGICLKKQSSITDKTSVKCLVCGKMVRFQQINNGMPNNLKDLFHPTPWDKSLPMARIYDFQEIHRKHLIKNMEEMRSRSVKAQQIHQQQLEKKHSIDVENHQIQNFSTKLRRCVRNMVTHRKQEEALKIQQKYKTHSYNGSTSSKTGSLKDSGAQRCMSFIHSRGRSSLESDMKRKNTTPKKTPPTNTRSEGIVSFQVLKSPFNL